MNFTELFRLAFEALRERKVRSGLTILMVVVGVGLLVSLNGLSTGFSIFVEEQFRLLTPNILIVTSSPQFEGGPGGFGSPRGEVDLDTRVVANIRRVQGVVDVIPVIQQPLTIKAGGIELRTTLIGLDQSKMQYIFPTFALEEGTIVFPYDTTGILLGNEVKYPSERVGVFAEVGQLLAVEAPDGGRRNFLVRGAAVNLGSGLFIPIDRSVSVSLAAADSLLNRGGKFDVLLVVTESLAHNDEVEQGIKAIYTEKIGVTSPKVISQTIQGFVAGFSVFILSIAGISLLVAGVGVVTTLITSVMERTREIGLLKALGFKDRAILALFLSEAASIGFIGGLIGVAVGMLLGTLILPLLIAAGPPGETAIRLSPVFLPTDLLVMLLFATMLSAIAGLYPAWRASRMDPVVALRKE